MTSFVAWSLLILAGLLEVIWAVGLKYTDGFTRLGPSSIVLSAMGVSMVMLGLAAKSIPIGTACAVWVGVGVVGTAILGIVLFKEPASLVRLVSVAFILVGIVGLKLASAQP